MKYKNAQDILPDKLLRELQQYISGGVLYVPSADTKKSWGEVSGARTYYKQRCTAEELALNYGLSVEAIHKIV